MHNARQRLAAKYRDEHLRRPNALVCPYISRATLGTDTKMARKLPRRGEPPGSDLLLPTRHIMFQTARIAAIYSNAASDLTSAWLMLGREQKLRPAVR